MEYYVNKQFLYINLYSSTCDSNRQAGDRIYKENGKNTTHHKQ